ncbi:MAG: alpha/beta hydrolase [Thermodesulfobacteriota bacterium]
MTEPIMKKVNGDGIKIQLAVWEGKGKPILCLHGITANCRSFDYLATVLAGKHKIIAMDLRGRGGSDKPSTGYSKDHHVQDIIALLDDLQINRIVLMGHSLGAFISIAFAAKYPERMDRLILVDGGGKYSETQSAKVFAAIKPALDRLGQVFPSTEAYLARMKEAPYLHPWNDYLETYVRYEIEEVEGGVRVNIAPEHIQEEAINFGKADISLFYHQIQVPTLILRATQGLLSENFYILPEDVVDRMVREIPDVRRLDVQGTNHYSILFQPHPARDRAILDFLKC